MRALFRTGWAGTNAAHRIVQDLPTDQALEVLVDLLRSPEPKWSRTYRSFWLGRSVGMRQHLPRPGDPGPVEMCSYHWLAEALQRTNVTVDPLLPLLEEKPDLFWNVVTAPLLAHLKANQGEVRKLLPLMRHQDDKVVNIVSHLVANTDAEGISEPEFRRLLAVVPDVRVEQMANGLIQVARQPLETSDWLWGEMERQGESRGRGLLSATWLFEMRSRRGSNLLASKLASTNAIVRLAALRVARHPGKSEAVFDQVKAFAAGGSPEERTLAVQACTTLAMSPKLRLDLRMEAARIVRGSGDLPQLEALRKRAEEMGYPPELKRVLAEQPAPRP